jgi:hypothetical protein
MTNPTNRFQSSYVAKPSDDLLESRATSGVTQLSTFFACVQELPDGVFRF